MPLIDSSVKGSKPVEKQGAWGGGELSTHRKDSGIGAAAAAAGKPLGGLVSIGVSTYNSWTSKGEKGKEKEKEKDRHGRRAGESDSRGTFTKIREAMEGSSGGAASESDGRESGEKRHKDSLELPQTHKRARRLSATGRQSLLASILCPLPARDTLSYILPLRYVLLEKDIGTDTTLRSECKLSHVYCF